MRKQSKFLAAAMLALGLTSTAHAQAQQQQPQGNGLFLGNNGANQQQGRGGRGGNAPSGPAPRDANGKIIIGSLPGERQGLWLPGPAQIADAKDVPFQPWAKALYDFRQTTELEPHTRCKASGGPRQFVTPYGVEIMEIPELKRAFIF
ncbi:MAG: hypothetical protein RL328_1246, partial [Acidobacteriota bacterium]